MSVCVYFFLLKIQYQILYSQVTYDFLLVLTFLKIQKYCIQAKINSKYMYRQNYFKLKYPSE